MPYNSDVRFILYFNIAFGYTLQGMNMKLETWNSPMMSEHTPPLLFPASFKFILYLKYSNQSVNSLYYHAVVIRHVETAYAILHAKPQKRMRKRAWMFNWERKKMIDNHEKMSEFFGTFDGSIFHRSSALDLRTRQNAIGDPFENLHRFNTSHFYLFDDSVHHPQSLWKLKRTPRKTPRISRTITIKATTTILLLLTRNKKFDRRLT